MLMLCCYGMSSVSELVLRGLLTASTGGLLSSALATLASIPATASGPTVSVSVSTFHSQTEALDKAKVTAKTTVKKFEAQLNDLSASSQYAALRQELTDLVLQVTFCALL